MLESLTLECTLWVVKERGLKLVLADGRPVVDGPNRQVTTDLLAELKQYRAEVLHLLETQALVYPKSCPAWRLFRFHEWDSQNPMFGMVSSMSLMRESSWLPWMNGWRWLFEKDRWRPMPPERTR